MLYKKMIARAIVKLPFEFTLPDGEEYLRYEYKYDDYVVVINPPMFQVEPQAHNGITINERPSHQADTIVIDFQKTEFNREVNREFSPPVSVVEEIINDFLNRIRHVVRGFQIKPINQSTDLRIQYLNDDFTELEQKEGFVRGYGRKHFNFNVIAVTADVWNDVHSLPMQGELPIWRSLLLDAEALLPEIGPSVVLTFTALEVFIAKILDLKAKNDNKDIELWDWVNNRKSKNPSVEEQYDLLAKQLLGSSLKERQDLWIIFKELQQARNSFAHTGVAKISKKEQTVVNVVKVRSFIINANEIIKYFRDKLPVELQWPEYDHKININFSRALDLS